MKQAVLLMTNRSDLAVSARIEDLLAATNAETDFFILYNQSGDTIPPSLEKYRENIFSFSSDIIFEMGYLPLGDSLVMGNCHFPLLKFFLSHQSYDFYWTIEDDVSFRGEWSYLFNHYKEDESDLISCFVKKKEDEPEWPWWRTLSANGENIREEDIVCSFNPIYRISNKGLGCLHSCLSKGWCGHAEVVVATALSHNGLEIKDMGGTGRYVQDGEEEFFYTKDTHSHKALDIQVTRPNTIYHPAKEKMSSSILRKNCVISAVGRGSMHKKWIDGDECRDFDIHLIVYDDSFSDFYDDADFINFKKGYKLRLVHDYLNSHPEYLRHYSYFFIPVR